MDDLWKIMTFQPYYGSLTTEDIFFGICFWILSAMALFLLGILIAQLFYTIYRLIAYDYQDEERSATVTDKEYHSSYTTTITSGKVITPVHHPAQYIVKVVTKDGLNDTVDDKDLFDWAKKGKQMQVVMRIGRSREDDPKIKYWRIINYSWH